MKQILLLTAVFLGSIVSKGQSEDNGDNILIGNLEQQSKDASGIKEVDLLNAIAWEYMWYGSDKTPSYNYASIAKKKAETIHYEKGVGYATFMLAYQYVRSNKTLADSMFRAARHIGEKLNDAKLLGWYYYQVWNLPKALAYFRKAGDVDGEAEVVT